MSEDLQTTFPNVFFLIIMLWFSCNLNILRIQPKYAITDWGNGMSPNNPLMTQFTDVTSKHIGLRHQAQYVQ